MGRPPSSGGPSFRFNTVEVAEMEAILQAHHCTVPAREVLDALAQRFSSSAERSGKLEVSGKQVWNWFQNRRYALRAKAARASVPVQVNMPVVAQHDQSAVRNVSQVPQHQTLYYQDHHQPATTNTVRSTPPVSHPTNTPSAKSAGSNASENSVMEFEAKSARDGAWYDVASFLSYRALESADPEALVRFAGFGSEEDEWVNIRRHVRQRSLPCESSECVAVLPGDLILCFQEGKEQALYFDAHVLDAQRRRHDVRGCRCRFLVRYDHDQSEEIVPLRKICRRPETDYRLQQLHGMSSNVDTQKPGMDAKSRNAVKVDASGMVTQKQLKHEEHVDTGSMTTIPFPATKGESAFPSANPAPVPVTPSGEYTLPSAAPAAASFPPSSESALPSAINASSSVPSSGEFALPSATNASSSFPPSDESALPSAINASSIVPSSSESALPSATSASSSESALPFAASASSAVPPSSESAFPPSANATSSVPPCGESALSSPAAATSRVTPSGELALPSSVNAISSIPPSGESTLTCAAIATTSVSPPGEPALPVAVTTDAAPFGESALSAAASTNTAPSGESALPSTVSTYVVPSGESSLLPAATDAANITSTSESVTPAAAAHATIITSTSESVTPAAAAPAVYTSTSESLSPTAAAPAADVTTTLESTDRHLAGPMLE